ncbi:MAG: DUF1015 family protein, partial [Oscillospiraceae bacterium]|nr:DUF1015 family protein [Oscillospiraceae bacterium]
TPLYSGKLMQGGGTLRGWALEDPETCRRIVKLVDEMGSREQFDKKYPQAAGQPPITLAVGDGNHSLATAKANWEEIKAGLTPEEQAAHPARYCLVELCNIHSPAIGIEPIHRVVFGAGGEAFAADLRALCKEQGIGLKEGAAAAACPQQAALVWENGEAAIGFDSGAEPLCVGTVEKLIGLYLAKNPAARVDYIHGDDTARSLAKEGAVAFILPDFDKGDIFKGVVLGGVLPRKTFSMGHADEKRYYMECRRIEP